MLKREPMLSTKASEAKHPPRLRKKRHLLRKLFLLVMLGLFGLGAYDGLAAVHFLQTLNHNTFTSVGNQVQTEAWTGTGRVNLLIMGVDNRNHDAHPRSDTMILFSLDPQTGQSDILSVMRDSYVTIPGQGEDKINAAFAYGGPDLAVRTVSQFLQVPIHYYMVTDFQGFEKIIDAIGGVTIDVEKDMDYTDDGVYDIHLKKGVQHLDGKHALMYVRFRHDQLSDFARTERQRKLLQAVAAELKTPVMLMKLPEILQAAAPYAQTNITPEDVLKLSPVLAKWKASEIKSAQIPPSEALQEGYTENGEAILIPDLTATRQVVHSLLGITGNVVSSDSSSMTENGKTPDKTALQGQKMTVTGIYVNIRQGPSLEDAIIAQVHQGDTVTVLNQTDNGWSQVVLSDETQGYMASQFLQAP